MDENEDGLLKSTSNQVKNQAIKQGTKKAREKITKEATQKVATSVAKKSALAAAAPVLGVVAIVVLVIVLAIGIASFLVTMPGLAIGELKNLAMDFGKGIASYFGADSTKMVDNEEIIKLLNYLDDMGYDLKGYGFLTEYKTEADVDGNSYLDEDVGVTRYKEDEGEKSADSIKKAESEYLFDYMVSDNYVYTVKNFNMVTIEGENWYDAIFGVAKAVFARAVEASPLSFLANFDEEWGKGMIALYREGSGFGIQGDFYQNSLLGDNIEVDYDKKLLKIKRGFLGDTYEYKMDGWLGRYGVPVDFLLSLHLGTMMPDLAVDVGTSFPTEVIILLHPQDAEEIGTEVVNEAGEVSEITVSTDRYIPYISKVKDHWYRDVYFVKDDDRAFVQTDLEYESVMNERWTLYETADNGEYKLYAINSKGEYANKASEIRNYDRASSKFIQENGMYLFNGTRDEAQELGLDVTKKAITADYSADDYDDLGWKNTDGIWTAYELKDNNSIKQTGEAIRTETNPAIKQIFLYNTYFRYDGSPDTAEAITQLKKKYGIQDGALDLTYDLSNGTDTIKNKKVEIETQDGNKKEYSIEDVSGKVVLNQDSLNAFTMLENTNTLDADYIYRDFKELIVELGYFTKEELAEETPRLLAWPVPETGSLGYPYRVVDKNESEFGSMIHSKGDITAAKKTNIKEYLKKNGAEEVVPSSGVVEAQLRTPRTVGAPVKIGDSGSSSDGNQGFLDVAYEVAERVHGFSYLGAAEGNYSFPIPDSQTTLSCSSYVSECVYQAGYEEQVAGPQKIYAQDTAAAALAQFLDVGIEIPTFLVMESYCDSELESLCSSNGVELIKINESNREEELAPGDIGFNLEEPHTYIFVEKGDNISFSHIGFPELCSGDASDNYVTPFSYDALHCAVRLEDVNRKEKKNKYVGYKGNEAVVSPVTGILLEYGTYDDSARQKDERINVDLKYGNNVLAKDNTSVEIKEKVGYAKILVLDAEYYKKLEKNSGSYWMNNSLVNNSSSFDRKLLDDPDLKSKDDLKDKDKWNNLNTTVYGYKEFAEAYENGKIAGNIVYIDGFKTQKVDESLKDDDEIEKKIPSGEEITLDTFRNVDPENDENTEYIVDRAYKSVSNSSTEKMEVENIIKRDAMSSYVLNDGGKELIYIKEGTVLGRTMTDKELLEASYMRNGAYGTYEQKREQKDENGDKVQEVIGNYLRIVFRDKDDTVVENVEDYMKLGNNHIMTLGEELARFALSICCSASGTDYLTEQDIIDAGLDGEWGVFNEKVYVRTEDGRLYMKDRTGDPESWGFKEPCIGLKQSDEYNKWQEEKCIPSNYPNANWYACCSPLPAGLVAEVGHDMNMTVLALEQAEYARNNPDLYEVIDWDGNKSLDEQCEPGDIINWTVGQHSMVYVGNDLAQEYFPGSNGNIVESGQGSRTMCGLTYWNDDIKGFCGAIDTVIIRMKE